MLISLKLFSIVFSGVVMRAAENRRNVFNNRITQHLSYGPYK